MVTGTETQEVNLGKYKDTIKGSFMTFKNRNVDQKIYLSLLQ